jgi:hypothetical protein
MRWGVVKWRAIALGLIGTAVAPAAPAAADGPPWYPIGPSPAQRVEFRGAPPTQGRVPDLRVAPLGDVNGDGDDDVGAAFVGAGPPYDGAVHVVFGDPAASGMMRIEDRPDDGLLIKAPSLKGPAVGLGDLDADGLDDFAFALDDRVVVVFGRRDSAVLDTAQLGDAAWQIQGTWQSGVWGNRTIAGIGDQNGDGRRDIAIVDGTSARVLFTPANGRGIVTTPYNGLADRGFTLTTPGGRGAEIHVGSLGDVNGDGRDDIAVGVDDWEYPGKVHAFGVYDPRPGEVLDLGKVAADGRGFQVVQNAAQLNTMVVIGDQNGDGHRDIAMGMYDRVGHRPLVRVAFSRSSPGLLDFDSIGSNDGYSMQASDRQLVDVGDQTGDGVADFASYERVYGTEPDNQGDDRDPWAASYQVGQNGALSEVAGTVRDQDGDGRPEILVANSEVDWGDGSGIESAEYAYFVDRSGARINLEHSDPEIRATHRDVTFRTGLVTPSTTLERWRPVIEIWPWAGSRPWRHPQAFRALPGGRSEVAVTLSKQDPGVTEDSQWRLVLESESGATFYGDWRGYSSYSGYEPPYQPPWSMYRPPSSSYQPWSGAPPAVPMQGPPEPPPGYIAYHALRGTHNADHLIGTERADKIFGYTGTDRIEGRDGDDYLVGGGQGDTIFGQSGDDRLDGQLGDDRLDGGIGHDMVIGREGDDRLTGGTGNDRLDGKGGRDRISGGAGSDRVEAADGERDTIACGKGRDVIIADKGDRVRRDCEVVLRRAKKKR